MAFSFSQLGNQGRLGNQLFQIAATISLANSHETAYVFPPWPYANYFEKPIPQQTDIKFDYHVTEPFFHYADLLLDNGKAVDLQGYFQSEKYFEKYQDEIREYFTFKEKYRKLPKGIPAGPLVALQIRRDDYINNPAYAQATMRYYKNAIATMPDDATYLVFSDDIDWCKENLPHLIRNARELAAGEGEADSPGMYFMEKDIVGLAQMTNCDHFILANSTYGWWGAWLGEKPHSKVIFPDEWFGPALKFTHKDVDLIPDRWIRMANRERPLTGRIELKDVTFTIPIRYDHPHRKENLNLVLDFLTTHFDTNIFIGEEDSAQRLEPVENETVKYFFFRSERKEFHRTRVLNKLALLADTPYIANWDADVIVDPEQLLICVEKLRAGDAQGCFPYDGKFFCVAREHYAQVKESLSVDQISLLPFPGVRWTNESFGGAILWNKAAFIAGGMENENMISWGPEDQERVERFRKLGYKVERAYGPLYHINHARTSNSNDRNPHYNKNWQEYNKIQSMGRAELQQYVNGWEWTRRQPPAKANIKKAGAPAECPLNDFGLDAIYCVNLVRRPDRLEHAKAQFEKIGLENVIIFPAIDGQQQQQSSLYGHIAPGMIGCYLSHVSIYRQALAAGHDHILILEDDLLFAPGFNQLIRMALQEIPEDWEFAYLGCQEHGGFGTHERAVNNFWVVPKSVWGTQGYMVRGRHALEALLQGLERMQYQIDIQLSRYVLPKSGLKYYSIFPTNMISQAFAKLGTDVQVETYQ